MENDNGYKLYDDETSLFSWHETLEDAFSRQSFERRIYGRDLRIAAVTDMERFAYGSKLYDSQ